MFKAQRSILFQPEGILQAPSHHGIDSMEEITIKTHDNINITCWYHAPPDKNSPLLVYFHGNAFHIGDEWRFNKYKSFIENFGLMVYNNGLINALTFAKAKRDEHDVYTHISAWLQNPNFLWVIMIESNNVSLICNPEIQKI